MIRIMDNARVVILRPEHDATPVLVADFKAAGAREAALIIQTVERETQPICPVCAEPEELGVCQNRASVVICDSCSAVYIALRFTTGTGKVLWHCFPWY